MNRGVATRAAARRRRQGGFTLIEVLIASAIGLLVMGALTSVVLTTVLADNAATGRVEASAQIRNFQLTAYDDIALSRAPATSGCGTAANPCTTQPLTLSGLRMPNLVAGSPSAFTVTYTWNPPSRAVTRTVTAGTQVTASDVTAFSWFVDPSGAHPSIVVSMTVTVADYNTTYSESQTLRFYPRVTSP